MKKVLKKCWRWVRDAFIWVIAGTLFLLWTVSVFIGIPMVVIFGVIKLIMMVIGG